MLKHSTISALTRNLIVSSLCLLLAATAAPGQSTNTPENQELLNGLRIVFCPKPGSPDVLVKLRIHSGSAFDLAGKAGQMSLLGDLLFPDPTTRDYFTDQMSGKFDVTVNYDSITITMMGKAEELDNILDVLRNGILATPLTPEIVNRIRDSRIKIVKDTAVSPALIADRAAAVRLFGDFPYGKPAGGTAEDLARVDRADLMLARDRFLNSNNATLAIVGGISKTRTLRVIKQLFGPWRKSENVVPSTFRAPNKPDPRTLLVNVPSASAEIRLAIRGVSRSDPDFYPALILSKVAEDRWQAAAPELLTKPLFVRSESFVLPGSLTMGATVSVQQVADSISVARKVVESFLTTPVTAPELDRAKRETHAELTAILTRPENSPDPWLDTHTYKLVAVQDPLTALQAVSVTDVQRTATRLFKEAAIASVVIGDVAQLKPALEGRIQFEVLGEKPDPTPSPKPPTKPGTDSNPR